MIAATCEVSCSVTPKDTIICYPSRAHNGAAGVVVVETRTGTELAEVLLSRASARKLGNALIELGADNAV